MDYPSKQKQSPTNNMGPKQKNQKKAEKSENSAAATAATVSPDLHNSTSPTPAEGKGKTK